MGPDQVRFTIPQLKDQPATFFGLARLSTVPAVLVDPDGDKPGGDEYELEFCGAVDAARAEGFRSAEPARGAADEAATEVPTSVQVLWSVFFPDPRPFLVRMRQSGTVGHIIYESGGTLHLLYKVRSR